ncbi:Lreu_0056 family protein [Lacticaseibacillus hulanensis]|uniref:Lreu_0056 family protein n=1 Tax=Lacticaseibacillus hulanensis TaxID=2493111 RepID=UPI000FD9D448|nr:DUF4767 domain-containing protein [Lacticaseibacillus hulanensis]
MKKSIRHLVVIGIAALLVIVGGCGNSKSSSKSSSVTSSKKAAVKATKESAAKAKKAAAKAKAKAKKAAQPWSPAKAKALANFMQGWDKKSGQQNVEYTQSHPVDFYGLKVPTDFNKMAPAIGNDKISYTLSTNGKTTADYAVVAIYSDAATAAFFDQHVYLFTLHRGKPEVLVTMQNEGNPNNWLYFKPSDDAELQKGFAQVVAGKTPQVATPRSTTTAVDAKTAGILLLLYHDPEWLKTYIDSFLWYGVVKQGDGKIAAGDNYISAHGDPTSVVFYSVDGNILTYKYVDASQGKSVAESPTVVKTTELSWLEKNYYSTPAQKQEVDGYAAKLQADKGY